MKKFALLAAIAVIYCQPAAQAADRLAAGSISSNRQYSCGFIGGAWEPGQLKRDGLFYTVKSEIDSVQLQLSQATGRSAIRRLRRKLVDLVNRRNRAVTKLCSRLQTPSSVLVDSFGDLPNISDLVSAQSEGATLGGHAAYSVTGTPPGLSSIRDLGIKNIFWNSGTIDALASNSMSLSQCADFLHQTTDGQSGGYEACYMSQNLGEAFDPILGASTNSCYMRHIATQENLDSHVIRLTQGAFPGGSVSRMFATPSGSTRRVVRLNIINMPAGQTREGGSGGHALVYVAGADTNSARGDSYAYNFVMCDSDAAPINEIESVRIGSDNSYSVELSNGSTDTFIGSIHARLRRDESGAASFDPAAARTLETQSQRGADGSRGKVDITITPDNVLLLKNYSLFPDQISMVYQAGSFTGGSVTDLSFREGASKRRFSQDGGASFLTESTSIEYRSSNYVYAPANPYGAWLSAVDFSTDVFFASEPAPVVPDYSAASCSDRGDIEVEVDFSHPLIPPIQAACEANRLRDMSFCNGDSQVEAAYGNYTHGCPL